MKKESARTPTSEPAKRIAAIFHRQLDTKWSEKEIKKFRALVKDGWFKDLTNLALIERCYKGQWPPRRDKNILRHDLMTFLNNFETELDRAVAYNERHPLKPPARKIIPLPLPKSDLPPEPVEPEVHQKFLADFEASRGRKLYQPGV